VGLGLGPRGISLEGINVIREADRAYLERYTSPSAPTLVAELEKAAGKEVVTVGRDFVEDGRQILEEASAMRVALSVPGDPMLATTHTELRVRAIKAGIRTRIVHGATILSAAASASGLHAYKFGKTITYPRELGSRTEVYRTIHRNLTQGLHTLVLLEYDVETAEGVSPSEVFGGLLETESSLKRNVISDGTFALVLSRIGWEESFIVGGHIADLQQREEEDEEGKTSPPPACVIVPGALHFSEKEALAAITGLREEDISDNGRTARRTAQVLVPRYVEKTKKALKRAREGLNGGYPDLLENAELYMRDAENFLANSEDELAMLSIGYAEGLLDSLTFTDRLDIGW
jgi:diphthine synthase